jgi:hypothetical protein
LERRKDLMTGNAVLDAAQLIATAGAATAIVVQLVVMFAGVESPRAKVGSAVLTAVLLVVLYGISNALLMAQYAFGLAIAAITIAATGAGVQHAITTTAKSTPPQ